MSSVSLAEAKANLSRLIDKVEAGEDVVITRHGRPVAKVTAIRPVKQSIPSLAGFRAGIQRRKGSSAEALRQLRDEDV